MSYELISDGLPTLMKILEEEQLKSIRKEVKKVFPNLMISNDHIGLSPLTTITHEQIDAIKNIT